MEFITANHTENELKKWHGISKNYKKSVKKQKRRKSIILNSAKRKIKNNKKNLYTYIHTLHERYNSC